MTLDVILLLLSFIIVLTILVVSMLYFELSRWVHTSQCCWEIFESISLFWSLYMVVLTLVNIPSKWAHMTFLSTS